MSSGKISEDRKSISFELNSNQMVGHFTLAHIDGDELNPDKIYMKLDTQIIHNTTSVNNTNGMVIDKRYAKVLSHWFKHAAELMDEWYNKDMKDEE